MTIFSNIFGRPSSSPATVLQRFDAPVGPLGYHPIPSMTDRGSYEDSGHSSKGGSDSSTMSALSAMTLMAFMFFLNMLKMSMSDQEQMMMMTTAAPAPMMPPMTGTILMMPGRTGRDVSKMDPPSDESSQSSTYHGSRNDAQDISPVHEDECANSRIFPGSIHSEGSCGTPGDAAQHRSPEDVTGVFREIDDAAQHRGPEDVAPTYLNNDHEDDQRRLEESPVLECSKLWVCEAHRIAGEQAANILSAALIWIDGGGENYAKMLLEAVTTAREIGSCGRHVQACQQDAGDKEWLPILASLLDHVV